MSDAQAEPEDDPPKKSKMPIIIGLVLALAGGGGGFYAAFSGMILGSDANEEKPEEDEIATKGPEVAYVAIDPLVISIRGNANASHLKFRAHLEVSPDSSEDVEKLLPRVVDVLNSYLRAVEPGDLEDPSSLTKLRAQMLRRVQVVTGLGKVRDLLIMEFVLN